MATLERQRAIRELLENFRGVQSLKRLTAELNYEFVNKPLPRRNWSDTAREALASDPVLLAAGGDEDAFHVIYAQLKSAGLPRGAERPVVTKLLEDHPYALFVFSNESQNRWHFINVKHDEKGDKRRLFRRITIGEDERLRTASERISMLDLEDISPTLFGIAPLDIQKRHDVAFDVQPVTREFYRDYDRIFKLVESLIEGFGSTKPEIERKRLYTQRLFNRLMFIAFIQKKGWLKFGGERDYLAALWKDYEGEDSERKIFYRDRLKPLFFQGLSTSNEVNIIGINRGGFLKTLIGDVPYLNGGLFEEAADDREQKISVPDEALDSIINDLFERYNFTVTESTPLDQEVAVDPEMLGKVFEELVTGRNESGSYYTPKPVVSFMCRESLKGYLGSRYTSLVDEHDVSNISVPEARALLARLADMRVVDPACGSGAYLLGMLHELHALTRLLDTRIQQESARDDYNRKLQIIQSNLYGVDKDEFAVQIARLRLWLSLAVEYEGAEPEPLPNLDFKIECGDTLTAPSPQTQGQAGLRDAVIREYQRAKAAYLKAHHGEKLTLRAEVNKYRDELLRMRGTERITGFDWAVEFAEVFAPRGGTEVTMRGEFGFTNELPGQQTFTERAGAQAGGFDIVLANPPYVRMELFKDLKPTLRRNFPQVHSDRADLYVYFFARAQELLGGGGIGCFISSNKWLRAGYGEKLRQHLLDAQAFQLVADFGDQPVFNATAYPAIFVWQKQPRDETSTAWAVIEDLETCYDEGLKEHIARIAHTIPASQFGEGKPRLAASGNADRRVRMEASGQKLGELLEGQLMWGVKTGLNEAFFIDRATRNSLIAEDEKSAEVIKPLLKGDDIRRYEIHSRDIYLLYMTHGINIRRYPAIQRYLKPFRAKLEQRATQQEWYELQQPQAAYAPFFARPKISYPIIGKDPRFVVDTQGHYSNDKTFMLPTDDWYLLGVLNSHAVSVWVSENFSTLRGGYYEFRAVYMEKLPIPDAQIAERNSVAKLAQQAQELHTKRRKRVEKFLRDIGTSPAESSSRNPLEQIWTLIVDEFTRRAPHAAVRLFNDARDETAALTEQTAQVEREIDERVATLYGL